VTIREPRYTDLDRAELLALAMYRDGLCPLCGRPQRVCTSDEEQSGTEFVASYVPCRAKLAIIQHQRDMTDDGRKPRPNASSYLWSTAIRRR
jgi:hypothetical protein